MKETKQWVLKAFICSIIVCAMMAIGMFLTSGFDNALSWRILGSVFVIFVLSFAALPISKRFDETRALDSKIGIGLLLAAGVFNMSWIWGMEWVDDSTLFIKTLLLVSGWALAWTVGTFVWNSANSSKALGLLTGKITLSLTLLGVLFVSYLILSEFNVDSFTIRLFISNLILIVTGMIITPILKRFEK